LCDFDIENFDFIFLSFFLSCCSSQQLSIREGSLLYNFWQKPPLAVMIKVYLFNVTNAEAFLSGSDKKIRVAEVGPYVYQLSELLLKLVLHWVFTFKACLLWLFAQHKVNNKLFCLQRVSGTQKRNIP